MDYICLFFPNIFSYFGVGWLEIPWSCFFYSFPLCCYWFLIVGGLRHEVPAGPFFDWFLSMLPAKNFVCIQT